MSPLAAFAMPSGMVGGTLTGDLRGGEQTLDDLIVDVWNRLGAHAAPPCPVCASGTLRAVYGAHARPVMGRCRACGTELT